MNNEDLRTWVEVERKLAEHNARESQASDPSRYHIYSTARAHTLREVLEKFDGLMPERHNPSLEEIANAIDVLDPEMSRREIIKLRERLIRFRSSIEVV